MIIWRFLSFLVVKIHPSILTGDVIGQAYKLLSELSEDVENIDKDTICRIHSSLMKNCQFTGKRYIAAGKTRTETRRTAIVAGSYYNIECCPFRNVDDELEYICRMTKVNGLLYGN
jgi:hypothetical protein